MNILFWIILELYIGTLKFYIKKYAKKIYKISSDKIQFWYFFTIEFHEH